MTLDVPPDIVTPDAPPPDVFDATADLPTDAPLDADVRTDAERDVSDVRDSSDASDASDVSDVSDVPCGDATVRCGGACVDTQIDARHCGGCDVACPAGQPCAAGRCAVVTEVAAGGRHTCALIAGAARCWGRNLDGQLGDGSAVSRSLPAAVRDLSAVTQLAAGASHTCARLSDGTVRCWGRNTEGQLGDGSTTSPRATPAVVAGLSGVVEVVVGDEHGCARTSAGALLCWGRNQYGQLGDGSMTSRTAPVAVALMGVAQVAAGAYHTCARLDDGTVRCWGRNADGQLGDDSIDDRMEPVAVAGVTAAVSLELGAFHSCARLMSGSVVCWGRNGEGQLGDGTLANRQTPTAVSIARGRRGGLARRRAHMRAPQRAGALRCWGRNAESQLGDGTVDARVSPTAVVGLAGVAQVALGGQHSCARTMDGALRCWGANASGQCGEGALTLASPTPVRW